MPEPLEVVVDSCYIDPAPASPTELTRGAMRAVNGGEAITVIIVTCGAELGVLTVVVAGEAIVLVVE